YFSPAQYDQAQAVCVIGATVAAQLFPYQDPIGQTIQIGRSNMTVCILTVIGVLEPTGLRAGSEGAAMMQRDLDEDLYFPLTLAKAAFGNLNIRRQAGTEERKRIEYSEVWLHAKGNADVERLAGVAETLVSI